MTGHRITFTIAKEFVVDDIWAETHDEAKKILEDSIEIHVKIFHDHCPGASIEVVNDIQIMKVEKDG